ATRMGGPLEIIEHERDGLLIRANDPEELAAAIRGLIADPSRRRRIAEQARRTVESRFTMSRFAEELQQVYLDLSLDVRRRNGH
ncbi:MAG TPA: glycosyltransferase, partial [Planctomycetota bacterium]|nr:glycosyltransferase [Planctomycetota bacterium]